MDYGAVQASAFWLGIRYENVRGDLKFEACLDCIVVAS